MSQEIATCTTQMEEDEEDSRATPERPAFSPIGTQTNEGSNDSEMPPVKTEPIDADIIPQEAENTPQEISIEGSNEITEIPRDLQEVSVKAEPDMDEANAVDYDMPLAKTPSKANTTAANQPNDLETTRLLSNYPATEAEKENHTQRHDQTNALQDNAAKSALDAYLDGLATPIAPVRPRLRVKTEFALIPQTPRRETSPNRDSLNQKEVETMNTDISPPPPPPLISSISTSDSLADGIATPRISLTAINRLRVKSEFSTPEDYNEDSSSLPSDYFNDLLESKETKKETGELSASNSDEETEDENIPADFFDDLLKDKLKERIDEARNYELEEKYSDRLKELERLKKSQEKRNKRKKQKRSKNKSRKRSRSRSISPSTNNRTKEKEHQNFDDKRRNHDQTKRIRNSPPSRRETPPSTSIFNRDDIVDAPRVDNSVKIKSEFSFSSNLDNFTTDSTNFVENVEDIEEVLTPKQKRERAVKRATALLHHLKDCSGDDNANIFSSFPFVSTIRKLPTSHSYVQQQIYENRSPLHTVNNVSYKFNSHTTRFNMEEWGLATLPTQAAKVAKLVGCDAQFIHTKLKTIKIPAKLKKVKQEPNTTTNNEAAENEDEEELIETSSSLYCNVMTQTDDLEEFDMQRKGKGYDIAIQVEPSVYSIGCQTLETQSPTENVHQDDEAPILNIIRDLNENQLMAIHQFAELIRQPNTNGSNAMEMYKIQMQIVDIYKISQIPSALATSQTPVINNYTTTTISNSSSPSRRRGGNAHHQREPQLTIQSVRGADGTQFSINDPRAKSAAYSQRIAKDGAGSSSSPSNYDPRYSAFSQPSHGRSSPKDSYSQGRSHGGDSSSSRHYSSSRNSTSSHQQQFGPKSQASSPTTTKFYGRGGLRR